MRQTYKWILLLTFAFVESKAIAERAAVECHGISAGMRDDLQSQLKYMEDLLENKEEWIDQNKYEIDSYDHFQSDVRTLQSNLKKVKKSLEFVLDCDYDGEAAVFANSQNIRVEDNNQSDIHFSDSSAKGLGDLKSALISFQNEAKFLRVYDFQWAEKFIIKTDYLLSILVNPEIDVNMTDESSVNVNHDQVEKSQLESNKSEPEEMIVL